MSTKTKLNIWAGSGENAELSNLSLRPFEYSGREYASVEHAYQTLKSGDFCEATYKDPRWGTGLVKIKGKIPAFTDDCYNIYLMKDLMHKSFSENPEAVEALLATGDAVLTHTQDKGIWGDVFPGILTELRTTYARLMKNRNGHEIFYGPDYDGLLDYDEWNDEMRWRGTGTHSLS